MASRAKPLAGKRVLIVEDSYLVAVEMRKLVLGLGGQALGPAKSLDAARDILVKTGDPDLALLDVNLNSSRVYDLAHELTDRGVPFIFATGYEPWSLEPNFLTSPIVTKPVTNTSLIAAIAKLDTQNDATKVELV